MVSLNYAITLPKLVNNNIPIIPLSKEDISISTGGNKSDKKSYNDGIGLLLYVPQNINSVIKINSNDYNKLINYINSKIDENETLDTYINNNYDILPDNIKKLVDKLTNESIVENNNVDILYKSCKEYLYNKNKGDGLYNILLSDNNTIEVYCDMTTDGGGWLDVVKTLENNPNLFSNFFSGDIEQPVFLTDSFYFKYGENIHTHDVGIYFNPNGIYNTYQIELSYIIQGGNTLNRCNNDFWVPMNGPGFNGGDNRYLASCPNGYTCIQGSPQVYKDTPINQVYNYDNISNNTLFVWSGNSYDEYITNDDGGKCSKSSEIPVWDSALLIKKLLIR